MGERVDKNKGRSYLPLHRHQDNQKKGLHTRPREQEPGGDDPAAKILKPCRVTRPREVEAEGDKPPSKVRKSMQWMKSLLGRTLPLQGASPSQDTEKQEKGGDEEKLIPTCEEGGDSGTKTEPGPSQGPGQGPTAVHSPPPPMEEE